ncbi:MAG: hypothetical protein ACTSU2_09335 [Promethearchaeota archaeon]
MTNINNEEQNITQKKKRYFRKLPLISGLILIYTSFFSTIPLGLSTQNPLISLNDIRLYIISVNNIEYYIWGLLENNVAVFTYSELNLENLLSFMLWGMFLFAGIIALIGSAYNEKPVTSKKILKIAIMILISVIIYFILVLISFALSTHSVIKIGWGFYIIILNVIVLIVATINITDYNEIK